ncbi:MAG: hypothetical protein ACI857_000301 [Arenicella sp.]|jgi:hypothetical protein
MKTTLTLLVFIITSTLVFGQLKFNTGSSELDADINSINTTAKADLSLYKKDLSVEFSVSLKEIDALFALKLEPGDVYLSLEIGKITGNKPSIVAQTYSKNKSKGWGAIANEMGIKPGSTEFHQLKDDSKNKKSKSNKGNSGNKYNGQGNKKK